MRIIEKTIFFVGLFFVLYFLFEVFHLGSKTIHFFQMIVSFIDRHL